MVTSVSFIQLIKALSFRVILSTSGIWLILFKRFSSVLLPIFFLGLTSLASIPAFADYWVPKLDIDLGLGVNLSQSKQRVAHWAVLYELSQEWVALGSYMYESNGVQRWTDDDTVQRVSLGTRYQLDFLQIRPWFGLQLGLSNQDAIGPVLRASIGLSYLLLENWHLSLSGVGMFEPQLESRAESQAFYQFYGLVSVSYSFVLAESFDEL